MAARRDEPPSERMSVESGAPSPSEALRSTAERDRETSLEGGIEERTVGELARGAEQGAEQPGFGREGS